LEEYATRFDDLFRARAQREGFRRYLEGLLLPAERNKTLTALANTEPVAGAQRKEAQSLQWFLSESGWDPREVNERRLALLLEDPPTAQNGEGVLVIDEHGDRKWGKRTAHVGRQWLANIGKIDNGVVSVSSLWADEGVYYPLEVEPYTPAHHFEGGKNDPEFRTKLKIARQLVERSVAMGVPFQAVRRWSRTRSTARTGGSSILLRSWVSATCCRSRSRIAGGIWKEPLALYGKRQRPPDGRRSTSRGIGRR
jgi:SRSO17 transposase